MNPQWPDARNSRPRPRLLEFNGRPLTSPTIRWRINGYPASLMIWSMDEWESLSERPSDAQLHPLGLWCALRLDD